MDGRAERAELLEDGKGREVAAVEDPIPVGILYQNPAVPCYEDLRPSGQLRTADYVRAGLEAEFDKFTVWPAAEQKSRPAA